MHLLQAHTFAGIQFSWGHGMVATMFYSHSPLPPGWTILLLCFQYGLTKKPNKQTKRQNSQPKQGSILQSEFPEKKT